MSRTRISVLAAILLAMAAAAVMATQQRQEAFPHRRHEGLFPLCTGCHQPEAAERAARFPQPDLCARCHDGTQQRRVQWTLTPPPPDNLSFDHGEHFAATANEDTPVECRTCHVREPEPSMRVVRAEGALCVQCHAHQAQDHTLDADCATCHVPLAETALPTERIAALPRPADHERPGFILEAHGARAGSGTAACSVCHTRERCTSCHVNAASVAAIGEVPAAPARLQLPGFEAHYPEPASHDVAWFERTHGDVASAGECAACHTRESCTTCHVGLPNALLAALPARADGAAPGVTLERVAPITHAAPGFAADHGPLAAADGAACSQCHTANACADCHDAPARPVYHPADFALRHSTAAYGGRLECSNCHDVRVFCQECHQKSGFQAVGRLGPGFHTAEPLWLLRHGGAARRGLESCTTCHTQRNCLQCHSTLGAFQVSPHGRDFDARRAQERNAAICRACHVGDPLRAGVREP